MLNPISTQKIGRLFRPSVEFIKHNLILLFTIAYLFRITPLLIHPTLWAEDATVFYGPLLNQQKSFVDLLFSTYAGQYFTFQFLIAKLILTVLNGKILFLPLISTFFCICATYASSMIWLNSRLLIREPIARKLIFGFALLAPSSFEPLGTLCGLHNYLLLSLIALAGWEITKNQIPKALFVFVGLISVMTSINGIFLVGALILSGFVNKKHFWLPIFSSLIIVGLQVTAWLSRTESSMNENVQTQVFNIFLVAVKRIGAELVVGQHGGIYLSDYFTQLNWIILGVAPGLLFAFLLFKVKFSRNNQILIFAFISLFLVYFGLVIMASRSLGSSALTNFYSASRYFMVIHVLIFTSYLMTIDLIPKTKTIATKWSIYILATFFVLGIISDFSLGDKSTELTRSSWRDFSNCLEIQSNDCRVVVPPGQIGGNWGITLK